MNKKILLALLIVLAAVMTVGAISASDVNITDSNMIGSSDDASQPVAESQASDAESVNSNTLSTNNEEAVLEETDKNQTELTAQSSSVYYKGSYDVSLKDSNTNGTLANRDVNFVIDNVNYVAQTDDSGVARLNLTLAPGKYDAVAYFAGDELYEASNNLTTTLEILSTINASDITKYYKGSTPYTATFYDSYGNVLANTDVTISVNGKSYTKKTNANGVVSLPIDLKVGTYKVIATDPITGYQVTTKFKILSKIKASTLKKVVGDNKKFTAQFYNSNGKVLAKKTIKFKLNGKTYKVKTNSNGKASLSVKNLKKGTYTIVCYNTDGSYKKFKIKVYKRVATSFTTKDYTFLKSDTKKIKVTLKNSLGYAPTSKKVVKIKINGKTYTKKTNSKGVVYLKLPSLKKGVYTVKYTFSGTSNYKSCKASDLVTVITTKNSVLKVKSTTTFGYGAHTPLKVAATAGGVALAKREVTFEVDGKTFTKTTNKKGIASLPIDLEIGNYTVKYSINKESKVNGKSSVTPITVKLREGSKLTWKSGTSYKGSPQTFKVLLTDLNGNAISGQTIKITINSKTYSGITSSKGIATIKATAPVGEYTVKVKFAGSNEYLPNSTTTTVKVTAAHYIKGVTEKNTVTNLKPYLKASTNCQVGNSKFKSLVNSLTSGLTGDYAKAEAIFNYVRDSISYSFYYDTKYGALGTLNAKRGNCVDHAHLLVALYRTAGLPARYVHGTCAFSSGSTYGHVWAQVLIGDTWICADATSVRNSFGKIVNWNTKSYSLHSRYASLPF